MSKFAAVSALLERDRSEFFFVPKSICTSDSLNQLLNLEMKVELKHLVMQQLMETAGNGE